MNVRLNGFGSGNNPLAATADWDLRLALNNEVLIGDGYGNVARSGVLLSSLETTSQQSRQDCGTF